MKKKPRYYVGVDVGGTKIQATLAEESGKIIGRSRASTPRTGKPDDTIMAIIKLIRGVLCENELAAGDVRAIGVAVPGVVDPDRGRVMLTPNTNLSHTAITPKIARAFRVPVCRGNDANCGILGEAWLGAARGARNAVGIFIGTGIGGGIIINGQLIRGCREGAGEIGHMIVVPDGPRCGCGLHGCLETVAGRLGIEREVRQAVKKGQKTILTKLTGDLSVIRSSLIRKALKKKDKLVTAVMDQAVKHLGAACISLRHLLDPELIVLGGGLVEACEQWILPPVRKAVKAGTMPGVGNAGKIVAAALGDDATAMGAIVLAQQLVGKKPLKETGAGKA